MHKIVNGLKIKLTIEEEQQILKQWADEEENRLNSIKLEANREVLMKLAKLDLKSIRALREGNQERLAVIEAEAQALREQLL
jgi:hypothetical protein